MRRREGKERERVGMGMFALPLCEIHWPRTISESVSDETTDIDIFVTIRISDYLKILDGSGAAPNKTNGY